MEHKMEKEKETAEMVKKGGDNLEKQGKYGRGRRRGRQPLHWSMISMLLMGWFLPLVLLIFIMIFSVSEKINRQIGHTISTSLDKAAEICSLRLEDSVTASKNASYLPTVRASFEAYGKSGDSQALYTQLTLFMGQQYQRNDNFCAAMLVFVKNPEKVYFTYNNSTKATYDNIQYFKLQAKDQIMKRAEQIDTATILMNLDGRIYMVRNLVTSSFEPYAVLALELNSSSIFESLDSVWGYHTVKIYRNGESMAQLERAEGAKSGTMKNSGNSMAIEALDKEEKKAFENVGADSRVFWSGDKIYASKLVKEDRDKMVYLVELNRSEIFTEIGGVYLVFLILLLFMVPLLILIFGFFHKKITVPLRVLVDASSQIREGNYGFEITEMADSQELFYTDEVFNSMSRQLKTQFEKIYLEEIALRDARIMALQSQINPHFLNNTLEIINWEARLNENYKVSAMIEALSTMLEATMNRKVRSMVHLSEELSYVDAYLYIIGQRFGEKFQFFRQVDEKMLNALVPRLIIQPIVENAVEHGMDITRRGTVEMRGFEKEGFLYIEIEDNGILTEEEREKIRRLLTEEPDVEKERHVSLGIRNVDQRLRIIYGTDCGLSIYSNEKGHTVSRLTLRLEMDPICAGSGRGAGAGMDLKKD
ncbi:MAG: histidine kinase [Lachnospiraceae bacterium]|nr:histidine kinase [Lachnospiraceae bacterium]